MPARRKYEPDPAQALANFRALTAASFTKSGDLVDENARKPVAGDGVRKADTAGGARKPDTSLEGKVGKSDSRSHVGKPDILVDQKVRKSGVRTLVEILDTNQVDARKDYVNRAEATKAWKVDAEYAITRHVNRLRRSVKRSRNWFASYYTQQEVADALCITRQAIVEIERGRRKLSTVELLLLAKFFDVSVAELLP